MSLTMTKKPMPQEGDSSPWGRIQHVEKLTDGVCFCGTAGHGGFKLSRQRNAEMPAVLRRKGGWYEEDCEYALVIFGLPHLFKPEEVEKAKQTVKSWFPDEYEAHTGETIPAGESYIKDERQFAVDNADKWVVTAAWGDWHGQVPKGMVGVVASKGGNRTPGTERRYYLVTKEEYDKRNHYGFVIDEAKHTPMEPIQ